MKCTLKSAFFFFFYPSEAFLEKTKFSFASGYQFVIGEFAKFFKQIL